MDYKKLHLITQKFFIDTNVLKIEKINSGNINLTYIVEHLFRGEKSKFILQSLSKIFDSHEIINMNHKLVTDHISEKLKTNCYPINCKRWKVPNLIKCKLNNLFTFHYDSSYWRAIDYIDDTLSFDLIKDREMAYQTGIGLGKFHFFCADIESSLIENNINNFHDTKFYIEKYKMIKKDFDLSKLDNKLKKRVQSLHYKLSNHFEFIQLFFTSIKNKSIDYQIIHGDPKLSNFLFDIQDGFVVSLIDLDTISSGYLLTDIADCIRSICNLSGEDPDKLDEVYFDVDILKHFLIGYLSIDDPKKISSFNFLLEFIYLIIFELTIRFLTDFLEFNKYFNIEYYCHNLFRAEVQFRLLNSFLSKGSYLSQTLKEFGILTNPTFLSGMQTFI